MSFHQKLANSILPTSLLRKQSSELVEAAWADTISGPFDPLRESDLLHASSPAYEAYVATMPAPLAAR